VESGVPGIGKRTLVEAHQPSTLGYPSTPRLEPGAQPASPSQADEPQDARSADEPCIDEEDEAADYDVQDGDVQSDEDSSEDELDDDLDDDLDEDLEDAGDDDVDQALEAAKAEQGQPDATAGSDGREDEDHDADRDGGSVHGLRSIDGGASTASASSSAPVATRAIRPGPSEWAVPFRRLLRGKWKRVRQGVFMRNVKSATVLAIDLRNPDIRLDTSSVQNGRFNLKRQARKQKAEIALNGDLFSGSGKPSGLHRRNGQNMSGTKRQRGTGMFVFSNRRASILDGSQKLPRGNRSKNVVSGRPIILRDGKRKQINPPGMSEVEKERLNRKTGRSAVGLSREGRVLYLAAASSSSTGQMARTLQTLGVDDALALDGSGSSQMYVKGQNNKGMVKSGDRRKVANAILVSTG
jgi:uncharacterized protein YigE (DUF2233 family)